MSGSKSETKAQLPGKNPQLMIHVDNMEISQNVSSTGAAKVKLVAATLISTINYTINLYIMYIVIMSKWCICWPLLLLYFSISSVISMLDTA